jgi:hypothetical protein
MLPRTDPKPSPNLPRNPHRKFGGSPIIHRNNDNAAQGTSKERRNPFRAVLAPKHHPIALADSSRRQFNAKPTRHLQNLPISEPLHPVSTPLPESALLTVRPKVRQKKLC